MLRFLKVGDIIVTMTQKETAMYKYQLHIHTTPCSRCGTLTPETLCLALLENGFSGGVITDHFYHGNSGIDRSEKTTWETFVSAYEKNYLEFKKEAEKHGLDIIFSIEESLEPGIEVLCYGITPKILYDNPQLMNGDKHEWVRVMRENGVVIIQAHPYREASYIPNPGPLPLDMIDGVEVYNGGNTNEMNEKAQRLAKSHLHLIKTSSADAHKASTVALGGIETKGRIKTEKDLARILKSGAYRLL